MANAHGTLQDASVILDDQAEANRLTDKGSYGRRLSGGHLELDLHEAAYLVEENRLTVHDPAAEDTLEVRDLVALGAARHSGFETQYLAYRDHRSRGYVIRSRDDGDFDGWARGTAPPRHPPASLIAPRSEGAQASPDKLAELVARAEGLGRELLLSVVDEESDVTYYELDRAAMGGKLQDPAPEAASEATARLLRDRALLLDSQGLSHAGYGNTAGGERFLSLAEAHHLASHGMSLIDPEGKPKGPEDVAELAGQLHPDGRLVLEAYTWLRELDLVPKTGLKFGVHYRVYKERPGEGHAPFLVQALSSQARWTYREVARFVRLSHSVKKRPILWSPEAAVTVAWTRP